MASLTSKPGVTNASFGNSVPAQWSQQWFQNVIKTGLQLADVRNAVGANGITISGNITQYATIGLTAPVSIGLASSGPTLQLTGSVNTIAYMQIANNSSGANSSAALQLTAYAGDNGYLQMQGSGLSPAQLTGGKTGQALNLWTANTVPIQFGINGAVQLALYSPSGASSSTGPSNWAGVMAGLDFGNCSLFTYNASQGNALYLVSNGYYNSGIGYIAKTTGGSTQMNMHPANGLTVNTAASVSAGSTLSYSNALNIAIGGGVTIYPPSAATALAVTAVAGHYNAIFTSPNTTGQSFGPAIIAGTNSSDTALYISNAAASKVYAQITGDGSGSLGNNGSANTISWTAAGAVTIAAPSSGVALTATGFANQSTVSIIGSSTSGQSYGLQITAGTTSADNALYVSNNAGHVLLETFGDGHGVLGYNGSANTISWTAAGEIIIAAPAANTLALQANGGAYTPEIAEGNSGSSLTLDCSRGNYFSATLTANCTISLSNAQNGQTINFRTSNNSSYTITWSNAIKWPNGTAPAATASGTDLWVITKDSSGYFLGSAVQALA
jgi:hypothetical protein